MLTVEFPSGFHCECAHKADAPAALDISISGNLAAIKISSSNTLCAGHTGSSSTIIAPSERHIKGQQHFAFNAQHCQAGKAFVTSLPRR